MEVWIKGTAPTAINEVKAPSALNSHPSTFYNVAGQKVSSNTKGLVIVDGKTVIK